ncbi:HNH endonuclease [Mastigocoleus sp. MO_188.B34]|uniref:HNH endonuclease n=1 Tax=Mastigocoleus sp. MO_188.B34 TaxID=3036635 RepID=UPI00261A62AC|nr:HNH endonuclease [Mastigocoleus sp. MO_188.B34]MDJ0693738.1 HNH endonuclease [Mastigocoleus sp. MO_188.B34]
MTCELCERDVEKLTINHLIPRQKKGHHVPKINICSACHRQIHTLFDNRRLARELNSKEKLINEAQMQKFIKWVKKQDPNRKVKVHRKA